MFLMRASNEQTSKNILLVYPEFPPTYWGFKRALRFMGKRAAMPPLGLVTVAAMLPEHYSSRLIDMNIERLTDEHFEWADAVFTSTMVAQEHSLEGVIRRAQKHAVPVVAGGPHPTTFYDMPELAGVSHFVLGEMEESDTLAHFLADFDKGHAKRAYATTVRESDFAALRAHFGQDSHVTLQKNLPEIRGSPVPRYDLLNFRAYQSMAIQTSRGCPIGCEFCDIWRRFGRRPRLKGAEKTLAELDELYHLGWRGAIMAVDDNFIGKREATKDLLDHVIMWQEKHRYPFTFYTEATVNLADDRELLRLMRDAGFNMVFVGIETPVKESLEETHKYLNTKRDLHERVRAIQAEGIEVSSGFIVGFDHDPPDIAERQIEFIQASSIPMAMVGLLTAIRDTDLYERLQREGRLLSESTGVHTHHFEPNFVPKMPLEDLRVAYRKILGTIYGDRLRGYFERCTALLRNLGKNPHYNRRLSLADIRAGVTSFFTQPFQSYGWEYLKFLGRTIRERPEYFPEAVRLAVMGHHFHALTEEALAVDSFRHYFSDKLASFRERAAAFGERVSGRVEDLQHAFRELEHEKLEALQDARQRLTRLSRQYRAAVHGHYARFVGGLDELSSSARARVYTQREATPL